MRLLAGVIQRRQDHLQVSAGAGDPRCKMPAICMVKTPVKQPKLPEQSQILVTHYGYPRGHQVLVVRIVAS